MNKALCDRLLTPNSSQCDTVLRCLYAIIIAAGHEGITVPGWRRKQEAVLMVFFL